LAALRRVIREEGMSAILVEQNAKRILGVADTGPRRVGRRPQQRKPRRRPVARHDRVI
jgi:hypothetical protein